MMFRDDNSDILPKYVAAIRKNIYSVANASLTKRSCDLGATTAAERRDASSLKNPSPREFIERRSNEFDKYIIDSNILSYVLS